MKIVLAAVLTLVLSGCAGINYATEHYSSVEMTEVAMPDDTYRVFDKPAENRMMITSSLGSALAQGAGAGLFMGAIDNTPPGPVFEAAAYQYLIKTGRSNCQATSTSLIVRPQFEVKYKCDAAPIAVRKQVAAETPRPKPR